MKIKTYLPIFKGFYGSIYEPNEENEIDYIKRLAGTIASHTTYDHNTSFESVLIKDYYVDKEGNLYTENERPK